MTVRKIRGPRTMGEILGADSLPKRDIYHEETRILRESAQRTHTYALVKPRAVEGYVTLTQLAAERGIQAQLARLWVKRAGIRRSTEGWRWVEGSKALKRVRKVLGLP